jgi:hypothetical protein
MWAFLLARVMRINGGKSLALTHQEPERQFLQERIRQLKQKDSSEADADIKMRILR